MAWLWGVVHGRGNCGREAGSRGCQREERVGSEARWEGVLVSCCYYFDLSLMSSQHMAAPGSLQGPARPPVGRAAPTSQQQPLLTQKRANFHAAQSASLKGNHISPGEPQAALHSPSLAHCHRAQMWRCYSSSSTGPSPWGSEPCTPNLPKLLCGLVEEKEVAQGLLP